MLHLRSDIFILASSALIISILTGVTMWDVYYIIDDYINNNRVTLVTYEMVNRTKFPFLNDEPMEICLSHDRVHQDDSWFQELWMMQQNRSNPPIAVAKEWLIERQRNATKRIELLQVNPIRFGSLSTEERLDALYVFEALRDLSVQSTTKPEQLVEYEFLNNIVRNATLLRELQTNVWLSVRNSTILRQYKVDDDHVRLTYLLLSEVCVRVNLGDILTPIDSSQTYTISMIPEALTEAFWNRSGDWITIRIKEKNLFFVDISPRDHVNAVLRVSNEGVFDRRATRPTCRDDPYTYFGVASQWKPCRARRYVENYVANCGCIPFADYREFERIDPTLKNAAFCSATTLQGCHGALLSLKNEFDAALSSEEKECSPTCTNVRNQYSFQLEHAGMPDCTPLYETEIEGLVRGVCAGLSLQIECDMTTYVSYFEKPQSTFTQFIGQVGGDIGLYTGLSVLSVWQMFTLLYGMYREYRSNRTNGDNDSSFFNVLLRKTGILEFAEISATSTTMSIVQPLDSSTTSSSSKPNDGDQWMRMMETRFSKLNERHDEFEATLRRLCELEEDDAVKNHPNSAQQQVE